MKSKLLFYLGLLMLSFTARSQTLSFTTNVVTINQGDTIKFTNTSTGFPGGQQFAWRFSDDCGPYSYSSAECTATTYGTSGTLIHIYQQTGVFQARLYSVDGSGNLSATNYSTSIEVRPLDNCCLLPPPSANYVLDGSFENFSANGSIVVAGQLNVFSCPWTTAAGHTGTPDIFGSNGALIYNSPQIPMNYTNFIGKQNPQEGSHYAGIYATITDNVNSGCSGYRYNYSEYIQQKLYAPLQAGKRYKVKFYVSLADSAGKATSIGALLSATPTTASNVTTIGTSINTANLVLDCSPITDVNPQKQGSIMLTPDFNSPIITSELQWTPIEFTITGSGQEYITIGHFNDANNTQIQNAYTPYNLGDAAVITRAAYYYIDNVTVSLICDDVANSNYRVLPANPNVSSITAFFGSTTITNKTIYVGTDLNIDQNNVTFKGCTFLMASDKKIIIPNYTTLTITDDNGTYSNILGACNAMWNSISLGKQSQLFLNKTNVKDGINAISNLNEGIYTITNCEFNQNLVAIRVDQGGNNTSSISGTKIKSDQYLLLAPNIGQQSTDGIYVSNTTSLNIGGPALSTNIIDGTMLCGKIFGINKGIRATNSTITVRNNNFIQLYSGVDNYNSATTVNYNTVVGGTNANEPNSFADCIIAGVSVYGRSTTVSVLNNTFNYNMASPISPTAISVKDLSNLANVNLSNNTIYNHRYGIVASNNTLSNWSNLTIASNKYDYLTTYTNQRNGVWVNNHSKTPTSVTANTIRFNIPLESTITGCTTGSSEDCKRIGIIITNGGATVPQGIQITNNKISAGPYVPVFTSSNRVTVADRLLGVRVQRSTNVLVKGNRFTNLGSAIFTNGNCNPIYYQCDTTDMCLHMFNYDDAIVNAQGSSTVGTGCRWLNLCNGLAYQNKMVGTFNTAHTQVSWWYAGGYNQTSNNLCVENINTTPLAPFNFFSNASVAGPCPQPPHREAAPGFEGTSTDSLLTQAMYAIAADDIEYIADSTESRYNDLQAAYRNIGADTTMHDQPLTEEFAIGQLYTNLKNSNIGLIEQIALAADSGKQAFDLLNNQLQPQNYIEWARKQVNTIYSNTILSGRDSLSPDETNTLIGFATANPATTGDAAYSAMSLLGYPYFPDVDNTVYERYALAQQEEKPEFKVKGYPNPASGIFMVEYVLDKNETATLAVYNLTGSLVRLINVQQGSTLQTISVAAYPAGLYYYNFTTNTGKIANGKFVVNN